MILTAFEVIEFSACVYQVPW